MGTPIKSQKSPPRPLSGRTRLPSPGVSGLGKGCAGGSRQCRTQVTTKAVPERSPEGHQDLAGPCLPLPQVTSCAGEGAQGSGSPHGTGTWPSAPSDLRAERGKPQENLRNPSEAPEPGFSHSHVTQSPLQLPSPATMREPQLPLEECVSALGVTEKSLKTVPWGLNNSRKKKNKKFM